MSSPPAPPPSPAPVTPRLALAEARAQGVDRLEAQLLLAALLERDRAWLIAHAQAPIPEAAASAWQAALARLAQGEPLAYVLGHQAFHGLNLTVGPAVLIPRPDTETLVNWALDGLPAEAEAEVLDLGTGSGAIALAVKAQRPRARVTATDLSEAALATARANGQRLGLAIDARLGRWWDAVPADARYDLVLSNPPYIADGDPHLPALAHEPRSALVGGPDGLDDLRAIVQGSPAHLKPGAWLLLEHGWDQAPAVQALLHAAGFSAVGTRHDLGGRPRCTGGCWPRARV